MYMLQFHHQVLYIQSFRSSRSDSLCADVGHVWYSFFPRLRSLINGNHCSLEASAMHLHLDHTALDVFNIRPCHGTPLVDGISLLQKTSNHIWCSISPLQSITRFAAQLVLGSAAVCPPADLLLLNCPA